MRSARRRPLITLGLGLTLATATACSNDVEFRGGAATPPPAPSSDDALPTPPQEPGPQPTPVVFEKTSPVARVDAFATSFDPVYRRASETVTLAEGAPTTQVFTQTQRTAGRDTFKQGKDAQTFGPETFSVSNAGILDLLVVVDDSTSMDTEQVNLATKLDPLLSKIGNTDWQIAVVSTSSPCLRNGGVPIKKGDANVSQKFEAAVLIPLDNTVVELGFPMAIKALKGECNGVTTPWLRTGSTVGVLILSDEDNCGSNAGEGCPGMQGETAQQMVDFLTGPSGIRAPGAARIYGLIDGLDQCGASAYPAPKYKAGIDATGGTWGKICDADYSTTLQAISDNVSRIVKREFTLTHAPDAGTIVLAVDGSSVTSGYTVNGKMLSLTNVSATAASLSVTYAYGAVPKHDRYQLAMAADDDTLEVMINGAIDAPSHYTYDALTREVVFTLPPLDDADIVVSYRKDDLLPTRFTLNNTDVLGAPTEVKVAGVATTDYTFDTATGVVEFVNAPGDGADVRVSHRTKSGRVTRYHVGLADPSDADAVTAVDHDSGDPVGVALDHGDLVFGAADVVAGRTIDVTYALGYAPGDFDLPLSGEPVDGSIVASAADGSACAATVTAATASFVCPSGDVGPVTVAYQAVTERFAAFDAGTTEVGANPAWQVWLDGVPVNDFTVDGTTIHIAPEALSGATATSQVTVRVTF